MRLHRPYMNTRIEWQQRDSALRVAIVRKLDEVIYCYVQRAPSHIARAAQAELLSLAKARLLSLKASPWAEWSEILLAEQTIEGLQRINSPANQSRPNQSPSGSERNPPL